MAIKLFKRSDSESRSDQSNFKMIKNINNFFLRENFFVAEVRKYKKLIFKKSLINFWKNVFHLSTTKNSQLKLVSIPQSAARNGRRAQFWLSYRRLYTS